MKRYNSIQSAPEDVDYIRLWNDEMYAFYDTETQEFITLSGREIIDLFTKFKGDKE